MRVVGITGMPGAGKSEAVQVAAKNGFPVVRMGDLVWEEVEARGLPRDAQHVGDVASAMRQEHGDDVWAKRTVERVRGLKEPKPTNGHQRPPSGLAVIDGIRSNHEVQTLRAELGRDFILVAIHTDPDERHGRLDKRGRDDDPGDADGHLKRDERELGWGLARTIALADEMIVNDGDLETFQAQVEGLLDRIADADRLQPLLD